MDSSTLNKFDRNDPIRFQQNLLSVAQAMKTGVAHGALNVMLTPQEFVNHCGVAWFAPVLFIPNAPEQEENESDAVFNRKFKEWGRHNDLSMKQDEAIRELKALMADKLGDAVDECLEEHELSRTTIDVIYKNFKKQFIQSKKARMEMRRQLAVPMNRDDNCERHQSPQGPA